MLKAFVARIWFISSAFGRFVVGWFGPQIDAKQCGEALPHCLSAELVEVEEPVDVVGQPKGVVLTHPVRAPVLIRELRAQPIAR